MYHYPASLHGLCRAEDDRGSHSDHALAFPTFDDLGIVHIRRGKERGCGLGITFAQEVQEKRWHIIHVQQGLA